jgi:hypothetical protein
MNIFENKDIKFDKGLSLGEIKEIEEIYSIVFPESLKNCLMHALPVSKGFYNWRDKSLQNIEFIRNEINYPLDYIRKNPEEVYWKDEWGEKPKSITEIRDFVLNLTNDAPVIIPVYLHRYIPMGVSDNPPIISVYGSDVIYYGKDLDDYFDNEFGENGIRTDLLSNYQRIPFWSDIM